MSSRPRSKACTDDTDKRGILSILTLTVGSSVVYEFVTASGSWDFKRNTLANSSALSAGVNAHVSSVRLRGGIPALAPARWSSELLNFHQPREDGASSFSSPRVLLTYEAKASRYAWEHSSRQRSNEEVPNASRLRWRARRQASFNHGCAQTLSKISLDGIAAVTASRICSSIPLKYPAFRASNPCATPSLVTCVYSPFSSIFYFFFLFCYKPKRLNHFSTSAKPNMRE